MERLGAARSVIAQARGGIDTPGGNARTGRDRANRRAPLRGVDPGGDGAKERKQEDRNGQREFDKRLP